MSISTFAKNLRCQEIHDSEYTKKEIVKGVLSYYSSQYSDLLFDSMKDSLLFSDPQELEETSFWANHKEACFVFKAVFSEIQSFFIQNYEPNNAEITAAISSLIQKINSTLLHDLWIITYGINIDLITALSGEVYESKSAKNLRLAIIPEENASFAGTHLIFSFYAPIEFTYIFNRTCYPSV